MQFLPCLTLVAGYYVFPLAVHVCVPLPVIRTSGSPSVCQQSLSTSFTFVNEYFDVYSSNWALALVSGVSRPKLFMSEFRNQD